MAVEIKVPSLGESLTEGTIARWLKKDGDTIRADEPLFELETEKATTEVPSPVAGTLKIIAPVGATVAIGAVVGRVEEGTPAPAKTLEPATAPGKPARVDGRAPTKEAVLSPAARRLADENRVDIATLHGTGRGGRITKEDVQSHLQTQAPKAPEPAKTTALEPTPTPSETPPASKAPKRETRQRISSIRQRIAARLLQSEQTTARLTTFNEADMSAIMALRERYKERFKEKHGVSLGFMSFFVKASVEALQAYPVVNARLDGDDIVTPAYCNIGVAVSTERGLMVPVVHDADQLGFAAIEKTIADLAAIARDGKITVNDLQGGTFTITNGGVFGSLLSTPILNPPQSAILGVHTIQKRPVAVNDQVVIRPMMYLALSYDHRLIDGREAVLFLVRVKECLENPERMLLEV